MELVSDTEPRPQPTAREMTGITLLRHRIKDWFWWNISRRLPRLVWIGDDIDVTVNFTNIRLAPDSKGVTQPDGSIAWDIRYEGDMEAIRRAETALYQIGLSFDTGTGCSSRDWEWDYSLRGDVKLYFKQRHRGDRKAREPKPPLRLITQSKVQEEK